MLTSWIEAGTSYIPSQLLNWLGLHSLLPKVDRSRCITFQISNFKNSESISFSPSNVSIFHSQDARVRGGKREERSADPRARQEEQPVGGEGQMRHHVNTIILQTNKKKPKPKKCSNKNKTIEINNSTLCFTHLKTTTYYYNYLNYFYFYYYYFYAKTTKLSYP